MRADAPRPYPNEHTLVEKKALSNLAHADLRRRAKDRAACLRREFRKSAQLIEWSPRMFALRPRCNMRSKTLLLMGSMELRLEMGSL